MPVYRFRIIPADGVEDVQLKFADDTTALKEAKRTLRDLLLDAATKGGSTAKDLEVVREDGTLVGVATPDVDQP